ncbi:MAG: hypothetical protein SLAVMIC_00065 [uncultured marine phage]|uniref:Uncharacterized protein n=1 Tax=uncultured marine phage TaxID=707152 RepID=A0A8D9C899_9VIRU|nr:MAG: hypothetical protein SLAVMIC_00065 [uncultured marine phage]
MTKLHSYDIVASPGFGNVEWQTLNGWISYKPILNQTKDNVKRVIRDQRIDHLLKKC